MVGVAGEYEMFCNMNGEDMTITLSRREWFNLKLAAEQNAVEASHRAEEMTEHDSDWALERYAAESWHETAQQIMKQFFDQLST